LVGFLSRLKPWASSLHLCEKIGYVTDNLAYPSVELVLGLHDQVVTEGHTTEPGVRSEDAISSALQYISEGFCGKVPETIHDKAVHLMRLLVAEHPFVDGFLTDEFGGTNLPVNYPTLLAHG
jgi:hypothetical protein